MTTTPPQPPELLKINAIVSLSLASVCWLAILFTLVMAFWHPKEVRPFALIGGLLLLPLFTAFIAAIYLSVFRGSRTATSAVTIFCSAGAALALFAVISNTVESLRTHVAPEFSFLLTFILVGGFLATYGAFCGLLSHSWALRLSGRDAPFPFWLPRFSLRTLMLSVLVIASATTLLWRWEPWALQRTLQIPTQHTLWIAFSPDGTQLATSGADSRIRLWDCETGTQVWLTNGTRPGAVSFSDDGQTVLSQHKVEIVELSTRDGTQIGSRVANDCIDECAPRSPDGCWSTWNHPFQGDCHLDEHGGQARGYRLRHEPQNGPIFSAQFSPDSRFLVTAGEDGTARTWDVASGRQLSVLRAHEGQCGFATYAHDGNRIATCGMDGTVRLWARRCEESASGLVARPECWILILCGVALGLSIRLDRQHFNPTCSSPTKEGPERRTRKGRSSSCPA